MELCQGRPGLWDALWRAGKREGDSLSVPDAAAGQIQARFGVILEAGTAPLSAGQVALNALAAARRVVLSLAAGQPVLVSPAVQESRLALCRECPDCRNDRCGRCGCFLGGLILDKTKLATERCPAGRWA